MAMFYDDHLAVAGQEISSSNFCILVDVAVMLLEEEHRREKGKSKCHNTKTTLSGKEEEEEKSDKRFFHVFPRKRRTFVTRRRNPQQKPNGASTSSSLLDLNLIPADSDTEEPRNTLPWLSSSSSSSSSSFLIDYKITAHSETKNSQNPSSQSSPSSTLLFTVESEKTEMKNPPNPNSQSSQSSCLTENTSRKRLAVQERKGKAKKAKVAPLSWKGRETPEFLVQLMRDTNGSDPRLIFEKTLSKTDVDPRQSRLLMPFKTLIRNDFLMPVELRIVEEDINNDDNIGVGSILFDQRTVKWGIIFKKRDMKKDSGKGSLNYALICGWSDMVKANGLKEDDNITLWSFRWNRLLCFAIVPPPTE